MKKNTMNKKRKTRKTREKKIKFQSRQIQKMNKELKNKISELQKECEENKEQVRRSKSKKIVGKFFVFFYSVLISAMSLAVIFWGNTEAEYADDRWFVIWLMLAALSLGKMVWFDIEKGEKYPFLKTMLFDFGKPLLDMSLCLVILKISLEENWIEAKPFGIDTSRMFTICTTIFIYVGGMYVAYRFIRWLGKKMKAK